VSASGEEHHCHLHHQPIRLRPPVWLLQSPTRDGPKQINYDGRIATEAARRLNLSAGDMASINSKSFFAIF
jgi:hypothetical protein